MDMILHRTVCIIMTNMPNAAFVMSKEGKKVSFCLTLEIPRFRGIHQTIIVKNNNSHHTALSYCMVLYVSVVTPNNINSRTYLRKAISFRFIVRYSYYVQKSTIEIGFEKVSGSVRMIQY